MKTVNQLLNIKKARNIGNNSSTFIIEAKVVKFFKHNNQSMVELEVKKQIGCGKKNCCSSLFNDFFKPNTSLSLPLKKQEEDLLKKNYAREKQNIKLSISRSLLLALIMSFYLLPLVGFMVTIFLTTELTNSPILLFIAGISTLLACLIMAKKGLNYSLINQLKLLIL